MGPRRLGFALLAALVISIAITSVFYLRISHQGSRPKTRLIVAAGAALQPGAPVPADSLTEISWPENVPLEGLIDKKEDVAGHVLIYSVPQGEPVLRRDLASNGSLGLAAKIPDGMRAMAVKTNEVISVAGFILPGSRVDVLVTLHGEGNASSTTMTRTVLQNVQVLSTGTKMDPDPDGKPENINVVTLLVKPEQSEKLALAQNQGTIHFVLRNAGDSAEPNTPSLGMAELTGIAKPSPEVHVKRSGVVKGPGVFTVETIAAGKVTVAKFPATSE